MLSKSGTSLVVYERNGIISVSSSASTRVYPITWAGHELTGAGTGAVTGAGTGALLGALDGARTGDGAVGLPASQFVPNWFLTSML